MPKRPSRICELADRGYREWERRFEQENQIELDEAIRRESLNRKIAVWVLIPWDPDLKKCPVVHKWMHRTAKITGNHFNGVLNTWRNFADKNNPDNHDLQHNARIDVKKAVNVVMKDIARYGSLKISFDKEIGFVRKMVKWITKE